MPKKILNIAHRGYSGAFAENTIRAFDEGLRAGADGFECDLRLTADGHVVVFHDDDLQRLCKKSGSIEKLTLSEVQTLKVFDQEPVPTLEELLTTFLTTTINLEIKKSSRDVIVVEQVLRVLTKVRPQGRILFSSFSLEALNALNVMDEARRLGGLGILVESKNLDQISDYSKSLNASTWNIPKQILSPSWEARFLKNEKIPPLWIWTLDQPDQWQQVLNSKLPFEAIITNQPAGLATFLNASEMRL
jgi:glycerophosphoryl diester phosphodiesterase